MSDPFSECYDALWQEIKNSPTIASLVRPGNMISFQNDVEWDPRNPIVSPGRTPQLMLMADGFEAYQGQLDNRKFRINRNYQWILRTSSLMINKDLQPLEFALFSTFCNKPILRRWEETFPWFLNLEWSNGSQAVPEISKGETVGWQSYWTLIVSMQFDV